MTHRARAVYDYAAESERELSFQVGNEIDILKTDPSGWSQGQLVSTGIKGWFPSAYVEEIAPVPDAPPERPPPQPAATPAASRGTPVAPRGRALPAPPGKGKPAASASASSPIVGSPDDGAKTGSAPERTMTPVATAATHSTSPTSASTIPAARAISPLKSSMPTISPRLLGVPGTASVDTRRTGTPGRQAADGTEQQSSLHTQSVLHQPHLGGSRAPPVPARRGASAVTPIAAKEASAAAAAFHNGGNRPMSPLAQTVAFNNSSVTNGSSGSAPPAVPTRPSRAGSSSGSDAVTSSSPALVSSMPRLDNAGTSAPFPLAASPPASTSPRGLSPRAISPRPLSPRTKPAGILVTAIPTAVITATATSPASITPASEPPPERMAKLLYTQEPQAESELSADAGELVKVLISDNEDWWYVQTVLEPLREGYVPKSYLEVLPLPAPRPSSATSVEKKGSTAGVSSNAGNSKTPEERLAHRQKAAREIVETEQAYVRNLDTVQKLYLAPLRKDTGLCSKADVDVIFSNLEDLRTINRAVLDALEKQLENDAIGKAFNHLVKFLKLYSTYCQNYQNSISKLQDKEKDSRFAAFLAKQKTESGTQLDLPSLLIMPVQRIPRYKLLFEELLKYTDETHPDYRNLRECLEHINNIAVEVNEKMRQADQQAKLAQLYKSFLGSCPPLVKPGRLLVREGSLLKVCRKDRKARYFFLFNDMLIYGVKLATGQFTCNQAVMLDAVSVNDLPDAPDVQNAFMLRSNAKSFVVIAESAADKNTWLKVFSDHLPKGGGKPQAPLWTPDSDATACRLCSAEFTFLKRRHHCRNCGAVVCGNCSAKEFKLAFSGRFERVCDRCYETLYNEWKSSLGSKQ